MGGSNRDVGKLFGGSDGPPRERVDAVVRVVDRYLYEGAGRHRLRTEKQTVHTRDLPPDGRQAPIGKMFALPGEAGKR